MEELVIELIVALTGLELRIVVTVELLEALLVVQVEFVVLSWHLIEAPV